MRHDPFDEMRRRNPIPSDQTPSAPMSEAARIVGARFVMPGWAVAVAAAAVVVAIGGATLLFVNRNDPTIAAAATTTSSTPESLVESTAATSVSEATSATAAPLVTSTTVAPPLIGPAGAVVVYLLVDDPTATDFSSQALVPVIRSLATLSSPATDLPRIAAGFLLAGPTPAEIESIPAITTAIPDGTFLLEIDVADGIATVDLSTEFAAPSGTFGEIARLEQLVYTLTRFEEIDGIRLEIDGVPVEVFGGHGIELDDPVVRTEFDTSLPAILIDTPAHGATVGNPLVASGTANVFEASISVALTDADGLIVWEGFTTATCGTGCRGDWTIDIPYSVDVAQRGSLIVWEESAQDGSQINIREHPVWLTSSEPAPPDTPPTTLSPDEYVCSGSLVDPVLVDQSGLPAPNASIRSAIFEAAIQCDWEALRALQAEGFMYSFGGGGDAIAEWQMLEILGEEPMRFLAELLNRPYGTQPGPSGSEYYAWPSAFVDEWSLVAEADREALRPLYDDEDFAVFSDFGGYFGYRVGIIDGTWVYFIAGD